MILRNHRALRAFSGQIECVSADISRWHPRQENRISCYPGNRHIHHVWQPVCWWAGASMLTILRPVKALQTRGIVACIPSLTLLPKAEYVNTNDNPHPDMLTIKFWVDFKETQSLVRYWHDICCECVFHGMEDIERSFESVFVRFPSNKQRGQLISVERGTDWCV